MVFLSDCRGVCVFDSPLGGWGALAGVEDFSEGVPEGRLGGRGLVSAEAGAGGTLTSIGAPSVIVEGGTDLGVLTSDDFALRSKA